MSKTMILKVAVLFGLLPAALNPVVASDASEAKLQAASMPEVKRFKDIRPDYGSVGISSHEQVGVLNGATMAGGVTFFKDSETPWKQWYNEILMCLSVKGKYEIEINGKTLQLTPGDMIWLPAGTELIHRAVGEAVLFYAVTPVDYEAHAPDEVLNRK